MLSFKKYLLGALSLGVLLYICWGQLIFNASLSFLLVLGVVEFLYFLVYIFSNESSNEPCKIEYWWE